MDDLNSFCHQEGQSLLDYTSSALSSFTVCHPCPCEGHLEQGTVPSSHHSLQSPPSSSLFLTTLHSLPQISSIKQSKVTPKKQQTPPPNQTSIRGIPRSTFLPLPTALRQKRASSCNRVETDQKMVLQSKCNNIKQLHHTHKEKEGGGS